LDNVELTSKRAESAREWLTEQATDALILFPGDNFYYLTGCKIESMERLTAFVTTSDSETIICPKLMEEQCQVNCKAKNVKAWDDGDDPYRLLRELFGLKRVNKIAIEGSAAYSSVLRLKDSGIKEITIADRFFSKLRSKKSASEIKSISMAIKRSENAYKNTLKEIEKGISEVELSEILEQNFKRQGLSSPAFKTIVAFGENSAKPHHEPSERKLRKGDLVLVDFGGVFSGYCSDITRTIGFETLNEKWTKIYQIVKRAHEEAVNSINADTKFFEIDSTSRKVISDAGFGDHFIHRVGHGLGLSVHEEPYLVPGNLEKMSAGTVFTVEPGIYVRGEGGVRIEDTLFFDGEKAKSFNSLEKDLVIL